MSRTYRDPIHQEINLDSSDLVEDLLIKLIDSREVQRLRWIKQLGTSWYTFHGAEHSRFPHSLGAMHVARLMFNQVETMFEDGELTPHKAPVLCAALLHDIGHGPFSHSCEAIIGMNHEEWTKKLILSEETEVNAIMKAFDPSLPGKVVAILNKNYPKKFLCSLVSSQLDCDRFDYLLRDSYYTGTAYGKFDLQRVISSIGVNKERDCLVVRGEKGMLAVEDYLYARYSMYLQVYQHKKSLATDTLLRKLFERLKSLVIKKRVSYIESSVYHWIVNPDNLHVDNFMLIDDTIIMHHIKHWIKEKDFILRDLAKRFIGRDLFKSSRVEKGESFDSIYEVKYEDLKAQGLDPEYYLEKISVASKPYSFYNPNVSDDSKAIYVEDNNGKLSEISKVSNVVHALVQGDFENTWLVSI